MKILTIFLLPLVVTTATITTLLLITGQMDANILTIASVTFLWGAVITVVFFVYQYSKDQTMRGEQNNEERNGNYGC
jgi:hypothetical protein